jgi:hypothetical protein
MAATQDQRLDELAEELTRRLSIPFRATGNLIGFREKFRVTDWAVPLMFDGHAARHHDALIPIDFVGHVLWPALRASRSGSHDRPWWYCTLSLPVAEALVEALREDDDQPMGDDGWVIGRDVLLEDVFPAEPAPLKRRRVA